MKEIILSRRKNGMAVLQWGIRTLRALKAADQPDFIDKLCAFFHVCLADFQLTEGDDAAARDSLAKALDLARAFDAAPDYSCRNLRFINDERRNDGIYDSLGKTALEAVENTLKDAGGEALLAMYSKLTNDPEKEV